MIWRALCVVAVLCWGAAAYPSYAETCLAWSPGGFGYMGGLTLEDGASGDCVLDAGSVPEDGFAPGTTYDIAVVAKKKSLYKFHSSDGLCLGDASSELSASTTSNFSWTAPATAGNNVTFYAVCATGFTEVFAAWPVSLCPSGKCPPRSAAGAPAPASAPDSAAGDLQRTAPGDQRPQGDAQSGAESHAGSSEVIELGESGMKLSYQADGADWLLFTLSLQKEAWIGFGISASEAVSMSGGGHGSDVVVCSGGAVKRYWVTGMSMPADGIAVPGADCGYASGTTTLRFSRSIRAEDITQLAVTPGVNQSIIFAHGKEGDTTLSQHGGTVQNRGGLRIDFGNGRASLSTKRSGETTLFVHLAMMTLAWGCWLPTGVAIASRYRQGNWFTAHKRLQSLGLLLQALGFIMAVVYCQRHSRHLHTYHAWIGSLVVVLGTLQPLNAYFRPHITPQSERKRSSRLLFEVVHKGCGWTAVLLGIVNICTGIALVHHRGYDDLTVGCALTLAVLCLSLPFVVFTLGLLCPDRLPFCAAVKNQLSESQLSERLHSGQSEGTDSDQDSPG